MELSESHFPFDRKNVVSNVSDDLRNTKNSESAGPETSFMKAVYKDSKEEFLAQAKRLVQASSEPLDGATVSKLLHLSCKCDSAECASALLGGELGTIPSVDELDDSFNSPLHTAAMADAARCVDVLLKKGARTDLRNCEGQLAVDLSLSDNRLGLGVNWNPNDHCIEDLIYLMKRKDLTVVKLLSRKTKEIADVAYSSAVQGRISVLTALLIVASEMVTASVLHWRDSYSGSEENLTVYECLVREALSLVRTPPPWRAAAKRSFTAETENENSKKRKLLLCEIELLQHFGAVAQCSGADNKKVKSPLIRAAQVGDADIIQMLLKANSDVNDADAEGNCALHWILKWSRLCPQQIKILLLLLEHGARVSQRNKLGLTAFHIAASHGNVEALKVLLLEDPNGVKYKTEMKETPLFFAVRHESLDCAKLLLTSGANSEILNLRRQRAIDLATSQDMSSILLNQTSVSLINHAFPIQHKCSGLGLTEEGSTTKRHVISRTKAEIGKCCNSDGGCVRGAKCFYAHHDEESWKVKDSARQSHFSAAKQLERKISVGGLPPSVDSDILGKVFEEGSVEDATVVVAPQQLGEPKNCLSHLPPKELNEKTKGTTNALAILDEVIIIGSDSRLTYEGIIKTDVQKKIECITPNTIATMVGSAGGCEKIWRHMQNYVLQGDEPKTISSISTAGSNIPRSVDDEVSCECFVAGFEKDKPTVYHVIDVYDKELKERKRDSKHVTETFATLGCGSRHPRAAWNDELKGRIPSADEAFKVIMYGLLLAALFDSNTGGILRVIQLSLNGIEIESTKTVVELYLQFYERFRPLENRSFFLFYIPSIKKNDLAKWLRKSGAIEDLGHPLTKLCGRYYMHRVVFKEDVNSTHLGAKTISRSKWPEFTDLPRELRLIMIAGKKVFVARQSEELLKSLKLPES